MSEIDKIYDDDNTENIILFNGAGVPISFEQIALIPHEGRDYVILKPVIPMEGVGEDEGLVFCISKSPEELSLVTDLSLIDSIFTVYDRLVAEASENGA